MPVEKINPSLKGVLPTDYGGPALNAVMLSEPIDLISGIELGEVRGDGRAGNAYSDHARGCSGGHCRATSTLKTCAEETKDPPRLRKGAAGPLWTPTACEPNFRPRECH